MRAPDPVLALHQSTRSVLAVGAVPDPADQVVAVDVTLFDFLKLSINASPLRDSLFFYIYACVKNLTQGFTALILSAYLKNMQLVYATTTPGLTGKRSNNAI